MTEPNPGADLQQSSGFRGRGCLTIDPQMVGRTPQQRRVTGRLGGSHQHQLLRFSRQADRASLKVVLDAARDAHDVGEFEPACQLHAAGKLQ